MKPFIIGIAGAKRSGKTTLANALAAHMEATHTTFAGPIREFVAKLLDFESVEAMEPHKEEQISWLAGCSPRTMMQTLGTEWGRDLVHSELWVRRALDRVAGEFVIVSDVRFPNEAKAIRKRGGIVIRVARGHASAGDGHVSENPLDGQLVDHELQNDSTVADLLNKVLILVHRAIASSRSQD